MSRTAVTITTLPVFTRFGPYATQVLQVVEGRQTGVSLYGDITAASAVAAGGSTEGDELLSTERDAAIAAISSFDREVALIEESHGLDSTLTASGTRRPVRTGP
jgi:hypothetical protein